MRYKYLNVHPRWERYLHFATVSDLWHIFFIAMPAGQLPVLEIDGVKVGQSITIARLLANKFNLAGTTTIEKAQADMILDCIQDIGNGMQILKLMKY